MIMVAEAVGLAWPRISDDPIVQSRYESMRRSGQSHNMAEVLAYRKFPGIAGTDSVFMEGRHLDGSQFNSEANGHIHGRDYVRRAEAAGVNPAGKWYCGGVARFPGDPEAWVDSRSDVKRICEERGWSATGAVKVEAPDVEPPAPVKVAPSIVRREVAARIAAEPELARKKDELYHEIADLRGGHHKTPPKGA